MNNILPNNEQTMIFLMKTLKEKYYHLSLQEALEQLVQNTVIIFEIIAIKKKKFRSRI